MFSEIWHWTSKYCNWVCITNFCPLFSLSIPSFFSIFVLFLHSCTSSFPQVHFLFDWFLNLFFFSVPHFSTHKKLSFCHFPYALHSFHFPFFLFFLLLSFLPSFHPCGAQLCPSLTVGHTHQWPFSLAGRGPVPELPPAQPRGTKPSRCYLSPSLLLGESWGKAGLGAHQGPFELSSAQLGEAHLALPLDTSNIEHGSNWTQAKLQLGRMDDQILCWYLWWIDVSTKGCCGMLHLLMDTIVSLGKGSVLGGLI